MFCIDLCNVTSLYLHYRDSDNFNKLIGNHRSCKIWPTNRTKNMTEPI